MATDKDDFAGRLIKARSSKGWSQLDLANASGVAAAQISRYEQGTNTPRPQVIAKLASALDVAFEWLLDGSAPSIRSSAGTMALTLQLPAKLFAELQAASIASNQSLSAEILSRLRATLDETVVTTVEARVRPGAEEKRFEFNADEIADRVVERIASRERGKSHTPPNKVIILGNLGGDPLERNFANAYLDYYKTFIRPTPVPVIDMPIRGNEPYGPKKSQNAPKNTPKKRAR